MYINIFVFRIKLEKVIFSHLKPSKHRLNSKTQQASSKIHAIYSLKLVYKRRFFFQTIKNFCPYLFNLKFSSLSPSNYHFNLIFNHLICIVYKIYILSWFHAAHRNRGRKGKLSFTYIQTFSFYVCLPLPLYFASFQLWVQWIR